MYLYIFQNCSKKSFEDLSQTSFHYVVLSKLTMNAAGPPIATAPGVVIGDSSYIPFSSSCLGGCHTLWKSRQSPTATTSALAVDDHQGRFDAADSDQYYSATILISSGHKNGRYDGLFVHAVVAMEVGVTSRRRRQGGQFDGHNGH